MQKLTRDDLYSLENYAQVRSDFRAEVLAHKQHRQVPLGPHANLYFEDRLTMHYQIQEMLRVEKIFEPEDIEEELAAYNPLIPDGQNWKATFMIEIPDPEERKRVLAGLIGIEDRVWIRVGDEEPVYAIADEDLERESEEKTSSVHFLRFELTPAMVAAVKQNQPIVAGVDHENYREETTLTPDMVKALAADLD